MAKSIKKAQKQVYKEVMSRSKQVIQEKRVIDVKGSVNANKLNIREKPDINSKVIGQLTRGQIIEIFNDLGEWYQIVQNGTLKGFVVKQYINIVRYEKSGVVTASVLNVRQQPAAESPILGKLSKNASVKILTEYVNWLKIDFKGKEAFVAKEYISIQDIPMTAIPESLQNAFFYQRADLASIPFPPSKTIAVPKDYNAAIAATLWNTYGGLISKVSNELHIDVATALTVLCVESSGKGFEKDRMIIRFENHVFDMFWGTKNPDEFAKYFKYDKASRRNGHYFRTTEKDEWQVCHTGQDMEWTVFNFAKSIDETAAIQSISLGAPQVMGFNYKFIGYMSPQEMFTNFEKDIRYHFFALFDFCKYKPERVRYLQIHDFYKFASEYNGPSDPAAYEQRLLKYYNIYKNILPA